MNMQGGLIDNHIFENQTERVLGENQGLRALVQLNDYTISRMSMNPNMVKPWENLVNFYSNAVNGETTLLQLFGAKTHHISDDTALERLLKDDAGKYATGDDVFLVLKTESLANERTFNSARA
ncbi:hypothetical protein L2E82_51929 [Cichorium intybus]|nr:hypothetical protein L2E82_51929 [Cichorium intybus]